MQNEGFTAGQWLAAEAQSAFEKTGYNNNADEKETETEANISRAFFTHPRAERESRGKIYALLEKKCS